VGDGGIPGIPRMAFSLANEMSLIESQFPARLRRRVLAASATRWQSRITAIHDAMVDEEYLRLLVSLDEGRSLLRSVHAMFLAR